jgi:PilZ domain
MQRKSDPMDAGSSQGQERRQHARYAVEGDAEVFIEGGSQFFCGKVLDLSLSGCFIQTRARLNFVPGIPVEMVFRANGVMLRLHATLRSLRNGTGAGFLFDELSERTRSELRRLIAELETRQPARLPDRQDG